MYKKERPIILSFVAIIEMLAGFLVLLMGGLFIIITLGLLGEDVASTWEIAFVGAFGAVFVILAAGFLFVGFVVFIIGYGLWKLNKAAWFVNVFLYGLSSITIVLSYESYLLAVQAGDFSTLLSPVITIGLFIYFLTIKDKFN